MCGQNQKCVNNLCCQPKKCGDPGVGCNVKDDGCGGPLACACNNPLVCDASSDIFSRPLPLAHHGLIFAGAQKNLGPSGISLVIARRDFVDTGNRDLPPLAQYRTYVKERSMYNTPNTFGIYMIGEIVAWIRDEGGLAALGARNARKAALLYDFLDHSKAWRAHARSKRRQSSSSSSSASR